MSSTIKQIAESAKRELVQANDAKKSTLDAHVAQFKEEVAGRDTAHQDLMDKNAKQMSSLEDSMDAVTTEYESFASGVIADLTENDEADTDSIKEAVDTLAEADAELDASMLKWGDDATERKNIMIAEIGNAIDVSRSGS